MAEGTPERALFDAQAGIEELRHSIPMDRHRRATKAALSDLWTAVGLLQSQNVKRLRASDRTRARAFELWSKNRLSSLDTTDPALGWVWKQRNIAQHQGDDVAIWNWEMKVDGWSPPLGAPVDIQLAIDPWGNMTANGEPVETSGAFGGAPVTVTRTILGAAVPAQYETSAIPDLLADALASAEAIRQEIARDWS